MSSSFEQQKVDGQEPSPGLNILDLEQMKDEDFWDYAHQRARAIPEPLSHTEYLECKLTCKACLVALRDLAEVLPPPHRLAHLPGMPGWMAGIMAWRGETIAVVNLDRYLLGRQHPEIPQTTNGMLLIASQNNQTFGLLVPMLGFTLTIEFEQIAPPSVLTSFILAEQPEVIEGIYGDLPILNIPILLTELVKQIGMTTRYG